MTEQTRIEPRLDNLRKRAQLLQIVRQFFIEREFVEIDAPILVPSPGLELHLDAFPVDMGAGVPRWYLNTSPEYQLKRLLAGGMERIFSLGKVFRRGESGPLHNPEFTMLEWYRANADWQEVLADTEELVEHCATSLLGATIVETQKGLLDIAAPWPRMSVKDAFATYANITLDGDESADVLAARISDAGHRVPTSRAWDDLFFTVFLDAIEPHIGLVRPTVLFDWPRPLAALARPKPGDARVVERFEVYAGGIELCNAFGELTDANEQQQRFAKDIDERKKRALPIYPVDEKLLEALPHMPPSAGNAMGIDRLLMLLLKIADIREILPFSKAEL